MGVHWWNNSRVGAALEKLGLDPRLIRAININLSLFKSPLFNVSMAVLDSDALAELIEALAETQPEIKVEVRDLSKERQQA